MTNRSAQPPQEQHSPAHTAFIALGVLLSYGIVLRLRLWIAFQGLATPSPFFSVETHNAWSFWGSLWGDLRMATCCACGVWLLAWGLRALADHKLHKALGFLYIALSHIGLLLLALAANAHHRVLFEMQSGLTYDLLREANSAFSGSAFWTFITALDLFFLLLPFGLLWGFVLLPTRWHRSFERSTLALVGLIMACELTLALGTSPALHPAVAMTPLQFLADDFLRSQTPADDDLVEPAGPTTPTKRPATRPGATATRPKATPLRKSPYPTPTDQRRALRLMGPHFVHPRAPTKDLLPKIKKEPWNIVMLVLESLGTRYMFDTTKGNRTPMPFMKKILKKGWYFDYHFSTANSSPRSLFSIFTGLYPIPQFDMFVMQKDAKTPTLSGFLPTRYEKFLVTPAGLFWYFPKHFFRNNGPKDLIGARSKPLRRIKKFGSFPNEVDVTSYFIKRVKKAKEPFFATYVSFVPHGPYDDYGPKYRILPNVKKNFHRYMNNLNVLDQQLARIFKGLKDSGRLKRTIVVMVGDHGQAFWQHRYNFGHSRKSFTENYHAPLFFYQPKLFKPKTSHRMTSHIDILPTLLDALQLPYNPNLIQGESLFQSKFVRKQIFLFGNEQTLSSMQPEGPKLQYALKKRRCWVYDLKTDPTEKRRMSCKHHSAQRQALRRFLKLQKGLIYNYNKSRKRGESFFGQQHPTIKP